MANLSPAPRWQFTAVVVDTGGKFATGITAISVNLGKDGTNSVDDTGGKLAGVSLTQVVLLELKITSRICWKNQMGLMELSGYLSKMKKT